MTDIVRKGLRNTFVWFVWSKLKPLIIPIPWGKALSSEKWQIVHYMVQPNSSEATELMLGNIEQNEAAHKFDY